MDYLLKISAIIVIFYGFYKLILQRETFFQSNRWFLLIGILTAVLVPLIVIPIYIEQTTIFTQNFSASVSNDVIIQQESIDWISILKAIYFGGILFFGGKFILDLTSLYKLISSHSKESNGNYQLIKTEQDTTPFSFFNFIVYNPKKFKGSELNQIIIHEKVHVQQLHSIDILISQIATIIFWFNPFIWLYKKEIQQNLEFIADDLAQQKSTCEKSYQKLLLKASLPTNQLALTNNFYNSLIKKRIIMLHKNRSKSTNQWKYALILPLITVFIFTFNTKVVAQNKTSKKEIVFEENIELIITKDSKKSDFDKIKKEFSKDGVTVNFKKIKRNSKGEITAIAIDLKSKNSNATYSMSSDEPIKPIEISSNENGEDISIRTSGTHHEEEIFFVSKDGKHEMHSTKNGKHKVIEININEDNDGDSYGDSSMIWVTKNGDKTTKSYSKSTLSTIETIKGGNEGENMVFISKQEGSPLCFVDGKEITRKELEKIPADKIESINILKGDSAIEKYGKKAENGVIEVTTKK